MPPKKTIPIVKKHWRHIVPMHCGTHRCDSGHFFGPTQRQYYLVHYIFSGTGTFKNSRGTYQLSKGQAFVIRPGEMTYYEASKDTPWHYGWLGFTCSDPLPVLDQDTFEIAALKPVFSSISSAMSLSMGREWYLLSLINQMLAVLVDAAAPQAGGTHRDIRRAKFSIETNYMQKFSIQELADSLHLERSYFSTLFKREVGCSPQQYLIRCRLENAASLLADQKLRPGEVAMAVGYPDEFSFSRAFRKAYGVSPSEYRRQESSSAPEEEG